MSTRYTLQRDDLAKIGKGALIAVGGALITYLTPIITDIEWIIAGVDVSPAMVAVWSVIINMVRKYLANE